MARPVRGKKTARPVKSGRGRGKGRRKAPASQEAPWKQARSWVLRAVFVYLLFNLTLNLLLSLTRPVDVGRVFELGHLDSRSEAALLLTRHTFWHSSWEDEQNIPALTEQAALAEGVDPRLLQALIEAESGGRPHAVSQVGACGLTQLMPDTARELKIRDPFDPRENVYGGARYLARLHRRFRGDLSLTLAAYNAGPGAVLKAGGVPPFGETRRYVSRITKRYQTLLAQRTP